MNKVSIIMSIYNESASQIKESIDSILKQSFSEFEFIIVNDNPDRDLSAILCGFNDKRIVILNNKTNIGLALSMNRAIGASSAGILARMDADDIALPRRIEMEYNILNNKGVDFVFSGYNTIDNSSQMISVARQEEDLVDIDSLRRSVFLAPSIIHHPTVMFTKKIFEKVGGYRNFPCSQDSDLWLRMAEAGCRFYKIGVPLLNYRINPNSVTNKRWYQQQLTCHYIIELSLRRMVKGRDGYSQEDYANYLIRSGLNNRRLYENLVNSTDLLKASKELKDKGHVVRSTFLRTRVFMVSPIYRRSYVLSFIKKLLLKYGNYLDS